MMAEAPRGPRVLVVEDDALLAMDLRSALARAGWEVVGPAGRLGDALRLAAAEDLDAALLDVDLRGERSFPIAELLAGRGVPFVFLTGYDDDLLPEPLRTRPALRKPVPRPALLAALAAAARRAPAAR